MAEIDTGIEVATEPNELVIPEIDQPDDRTYASLEQVLNGDLDSLTDGSNTIGADAGTADQPVAEQPAKVFRSQAEFDKAFGERAAGLRKQWERENAEKFAIANAASQRYQGKSAAEIQDAMILDRAKELAADTGYSEEESLKMVRARIDFERGADAPDAIDPVVYGRIEKQVADFHERYQINIAEEIDKDNTLLDRCDAETGDLTNAMLDFLAKRRAADPAQTKPNAVKPAAPVVEKTGAARSASVAFNPTDADIDRIDKQLQRGFHVRV